MVGVGPTIGRRSERPGKGSHVPRTQEERKADTRGRLLDAAASLFAERGIDAVSVDAVADEADRTSGAVYAHFGSKQGLLLALLDEWSHSLITVIAAEFALSSTVEERLRSVAVNVITAPSDQTRRLLLLERELWLRAARDPEVARALRSRAREAHDWLRRGFAAWMEQGLVDHVASPERLATTFSALVVGLEMQQRIDPGATDADEVAAVLGTVLGLEAPPARATNEIATSSRSKRQSNPPSPRPEAPA
jgi:AcrR family transcriptional regulator